MIHDTEIPARNQLFIKSVSPSTYAIVSTSNASSVWSQQHSFSLIIKPSSDKTQGLRSVIDRHLGRRGMTKAAFTYGDVFASMFGSYLCGGDCIEDVVEIKPFWDDRDNIRICSSEVILRTLRSLSEDSISYESSQKKSYSFNVNEKMNSLLLKCLAATGQLNPGDCSILTLTTSSSPRTRRTRSIPTRKRMVTFPA